MVGGRGGAGSAHQRLSFLRRLHAATHGGDAAGIVSEEQFRRFRLPCIVVVRGRDGWRVAAVSGPVGSAIDELPTDGSAQAWLGRVTPFRQWRCEEVYDGRRHVARVYVGGGGGGAESKALCMMAAPYLGAEQRRARVQAVDQQLAQFVHDFKQPLATLSLSLALMQPADEGQRRHAERCVRSIDRQRELLDELPLLAGSSTNVKEPVALHQLLAEIAEDARVHAEARHITIVQQLASATIAGAKCGLRRAFGNVLLNAIQLTPEGSTVTIVLQRRRGGVSVEFRDEGAGLPAEQRERVFEPFISHRRGGTGLGLAVARAVAAAHDGTVRFVEGAGGRVRFDLPSSGRWPRAAGTENAEPLGNGEDHVRERRRGPRIRVQTAARIARSRRRGVDER